MIERIISLQALIARCNRKLAKEWKTIKTTRGYWSKENLGNWHMIDTYSNSIIAGWWDAAAIENMAREMGVMAKHERLIEE